MNLKSTDRLKIALDIDDVLADFMGDYLKKFGQFKNQYEITRNVYKLRKNKNFWENLPKLRNLNFEPHIYCTKRINSKKYTKNWLLKNNFPNKPVYQVYNQRANKADYIKGKCDILIDDSFSNVIKAIESGLPALMLVNKYNSNIDTEYRTDNLDYNSIEKKYNDLFRGNPIFDRINKNI